MDFQNFKITQLSSVNVNVPRIQIEAQITDSITGAVIKDYTGANAIIFPRDMLTLLLAQADREEFAQLIANWLLTKKQQLNL